MPAVCYGDRSTIVAFVALVLFSQGALPSAAATYHVGPTGNDSSGDGSPSSPWREIRRAVSEVQPGDTVLVADGVYLGFTVADLGEAKSG